MTHKREYLIKNVIISLCSDGEILEKTTLEPSLHVMTSLFFSFLPLSFLFNPYVSTDLFDSLSHSPQLYLAYKAHILTQ